MTPFALPTKKEKKPVDSDNNAKLLALWGDKDGQPEWRLVMICRDVLLEQCKRDTLGGDSWQPADPSDEWLSIVALARHLDAGGPLLPMPLTPASPGAKSECGWVAPSGEYCGEGPYICPQYEATIKRQRAALDELEAWAKAELPPYDLAAQEILKITATAKEAKP